MKKVPKRRFKGFLNAGNWEQRKLGECVDISTGYPFDSQDFNENGEYLVITNGNIQENTPFVLNNVGNRIDLDDSLKKYILDIDDLLITMDGTVGRVSIVVDNKLVLAQRVCRIKSNEPYYIYQLLSKNDFIRSMNKIGHGGTIKHISLSEISEYQAFYPKSQKERIKISSVLTNYDELITLHQRKLEKLQATKKALLYELFPIENSRRPKRRFKGFTGDWEQRKLGDVVKRESVTQVSSTEYPAIEYEDVIPETGQLNKDIYKKGVQKVGILFDANKVLYGKLRPYLHNWVAPMYTGVAVGDWWVLNPCGLDRGFLYTLIQTVKFDTIANQSAGSKMPRADWKLLSTTEFSIPSLDEQIKIGKLVEGLNDYITLHQ